MMTSSKVSIRVDEAVCDSYHIAFFERCFMDEYQNIMEERGGAKKFLDDIRNIVTPSILMGADDQINIELYDSNELRGTVSFAKRGGTAYVWGLYVDPESQRNQIGTQLMKEVCRTVGGMTILSIQVMIESENAQQFYRKCGFLALTELKSEIFPEIMRRVNVMEVEACICLKNLEA